MNIWVVVWTVRSEYRTVGTVYLHRCMDSQMSALDNQMALWKVRLMNEVAYEVRWKNETISRCTDNYLRAFGGRVGCLEGLVGLLTVR